MKAFEELEELDAANPAPSSKPGKRKDETKPEAAKPDATAEAQKPPAAQSKPAQDKPKALETGKEEGAKPETSPEGKPDASTADPSRKFQLASDLRKAYNVQAREVETLRTKVKELETRKPGESPEERSAISATVETLKKRNEELEQEIRYHDYTKSSEYKTKFLDPFTNKLADAYEQVKELGVITADGERPATQADFDRILAAPQEDVRRIAKEMFGDEYYRDVLQMRRELVDIKRNATREIERFRTESKTRADTEVSERKRVAQESEQAFVRAQQGYIEKYPEMFGKVEGDEELNTALEKGFAMQDRAFDKSIPMDERIDLLAANRLKAAVFPRHVLTIKRLKARVQELEDVVKGYENSAPPEGEGKRPGSSANDISRPSAFDELDEIERRNPVT